MSFPSWGKTLLHVHCAAHRKDVNKNPNTLLGNAHLAFLNGRVQRGSRCKSTQAAASQAFLNSLAPPRKGGRENLQFPSP